MIENKMNEYNKDGTPKHRLSDLLAEKQETFEEYIQSSNVIGFATVMKARAKKKAE
jgi:hypothetical protein